MKVKEGQWVYDNHLKSKVRIETNFADDCWVVYDPETDTNTLSFEEDFEEVE